MIRKAQCCTLLRCCLPLYPLHVKVHLYCLLFISCMVLYQGSLLMIVYYKLLASREELSET